MKTDEWILGKTILQRLKSLPSSTFFGVDKTRSDINFEYDSWKDLENVFTFKETKNKKID